MDALTCTVGLRVLTTDIGNFDFTSQRIVGELKTELVRESLLPEG